MVKLPKLFSAALILTNKKQQNELKFENAHKLTSKAHENATAAGRYIESWELCIMMIEFRYFARWFSTENFFTVYPQTDVPFHKFFLTHLEKDDVP